MPLPAGARLGPYEILAPLGAGGMGEVYRARDPRLGREVAVKILRAAASGDLERLRRFELEARAAGALNHPSLLSVYDTGSHEGAPYLVFELLEGATLRERLTSKPLPLRSAIDYGVHIAHGLAAAHAKGIIHRDLKPENVFVTDDGRVKVLDFGLAKLQAPVSLAAGGSNAATASAITEAGTVLGTVGYMSPEQVKGDPADARSDIFAFGAVLYEMLTSRRAFAGGTAVETMHAILKEEPAELRTASGPVPTAVERIVRRCLEKRPEDRFESAADVALALEAAAAGSSASEDTGSSRGVAIKTLLAVDLVERTAVMARLGDAKGTDLVRRCERAIRLSTSRFGGMEVERDLFLFERPIDAAKCALDAQQAISRLAADETLALSLRIGIHLGEIVRVDGRVEGLAKATVQSLCALAGPNQALLTRVAFDLTRRAAKGDDALDERVVWLAHGPYPLQGLEEPVETFEVGLKGLSRLLAPAGASTARPGTAAVTRQGRLWGLWAALVAVVAIGVMGGIRWANRGSGSLPAAPARAGPPADDKSLLRGVLEPPSEPLPTSEPRALAIADRVMQALGGAEAWRRTRYLRFEFAVDRGGRTVVSRVHTWDKETGRYRLEARAPKKGEPGRTGTGEPFVLLTDIHGKQGWAYVNGRRAGGEQEKKYLDLAYPIWVNDTYWLLMPYKMKDPGVTLAYGGEEKKADEAWDKVVLTFDNVGLTPKDKYWAYVNRATGLVDRWEYILNGGAGPPAAWLWRDWKRCGDILLASDRVSQQDDVRIHFPVLEAPSTLPERTFTSPEPAGPQ